MIFKVLMKQISVVVAVVSVVSLIGRIIPTLSSPVASKSDPIELVKCHLGS